MKKKKSKFRRIIEFILFIICIIVIVLFKNYFRNETNEIMQKGEFAIGTVLVFTKSTSTLVVSKTVNQPGQSQSVKFEYVVNGKKYIQTYGGNITYVPNDGITEGQKYLIKYLKNKPQKSRMLFDYPIFESADFEKCIEEFEKREEK